MAAEVISLIVPALPSALDATVMERVDASSKQVRSLAKALKVWSALGPHPVSFISSTLFI